jgi:Ca2+-binding RTX toxin-like protein
VFRLRSVTGVELVNANGFANVSVLGTGDGDTLDFGGATLVGITRIDAGAGNDTVVGGESADTIVGGEGNDTLAGGGGGDLFLVGPNTGIDAYAGGAGTDRIQATAANTAILVSALSGIEEIHAGGFRGVTVVGSVAGDVLDFSGTVLTGIRLIDGGNGSDTITGSAGADVIFGNHGADTIAAGEGNDTIRFGVNTDDFIDGGAGIDTLVSMVDGASLVWTRVSGVEVVNAFATFDEVLLGTTGNDVLDFSAVALLGVSRIDALGGADTVIGSMGSDFIVGGAGGDTLTGGGSADVFAFERTTDSTAAAFDTITDFLQGTDLVDLSRIDANTGVAGDQAFAFLGVAGFGGVAGQARVDQGTPGITALELDVNGDAIADMRIELVGTHALQATDLVL